MNKWLFYLRYFSAVYWITLYCRGVYCVRGWWTVETWKFPWCHSTCRRAEQRSAAGTALLLATCTSPLLHVCVDVDCKSRTFCISVGEYEGGSCPGAGWWQHPANIMSSPGSRPAVGHQKQHSQAAAAPCPVHDPTNKTGISSDSTDILDDIFSTFNMVFHKVLESALIF